MVALWTVPCCYVCAACRAVLCFGMALACFARVCVAAALAGGFFALGRWHRKPPDAASRTAAAPRDAATFEIARRLVLSPSVVAASYVPTRWAVLTSTLQATRLYPLAICAFHWAALLQYRPYIVLVGPRSKSVAAEAALRPLVDRLGGRLYVLSLDSKISLAFQSMAVRVFAAALPGIRPEDEIVTTGADRLPLRPSAFQTAPRAHADFVRISHWRPGELGRILEKGVTYDEGNCSHARWCRRGYHFDIDYVRGKAAAWRNATFGARPLSWVTMLAELTRFVRHAKSGRELWFGDQLILTELLTDYDHAMRHAGEPSRIDVLYTDELAATKGWSHARLSYDAATRALTPAAAADVERGRAFEVHKLAFAHSEPLWSETNWNCTQFVLGAALRASGRERQGRGSFTALRALVRSRWWEYYAES